MKQENSQSFFIFSEKVLKSYPIKFKNIKTIFLLKLSEILGKMAEVCVFFLE